MGLANKHIVLGVTGGIAAYKSAELARRLRDRGARVRVVMTKGAEHFITPLTMQAVSSNPVHTSLLDPDAEAGMGHIELARWADAMLIAPACSRRPADHAVSCHAGRYIGSSRDESADVAGPGNPRQHRNPA